MHNLRVDKQATYIDVYCDGYVISFPIDDTDSQTFKMWDWNKANQIANCGFGIESTDDYYLGYDTNAAITVIENTPSRVRVRIFGNFDKTSGATSDYLANSTSVEIIYTIYPDRYFVDFAWVCSGTVDIDNQMWFGGFHSDTDEITNEASMYENSGVESAASLDTDYPTADYIGFTSDEYNVTMSILLLSGWTTEPIQYTSWEHGRVYPTVYTSTDETAGTKRALFVFIIDSADREGSAQIYNSTDRLAMGDQYKDLGLSADPTNGTWVADMNVPRSILYRSSELFVPTSRVTANTMTYTSGTTGWDLIDEGYASKNTSDYVYNSLGVGSYAIERYGLPAASEMTDNDLCKEIIVRAYVSDVQGYGTLTDGCGMRLLIQGEYIEPDAGDRYQNVPTAWTDLTFVFSKGSGVSGLWTKDDIDDLEVELAMGSSGGNYKAACSTLEVEVIYFPKTGFASDGAWHIEVCI